MFSRFLHCFTIVMMVLLAQVPSLSFAQSMTVYAGHLPPFILDESHGEVRGAVVEVVVEMMKIAGDPIDVDSIRRINWARAIEEVETSPDTMIFCMGRTLQRETKFKWVGPVASLNLGLVARKSSRITINNPGEIRQYSLGVVRNSAPVQILEKGYDIPVEMLSLVADDFFQFKMLNAGRVELITQADVAVPAILDSLGYSHSDYEMVYVMNHLDLFVAVNKGTSDERIAKMQAALNELKTAKGNLMSRYDQIMKKYMVNGPISMQLK